MRRALALAVPALAAAPVLALLVAGGGDVGDSLARGLTVAAVASLAATLLGTAAGIGLREAFPGRLAFAALIALPPLLPPAVPGAALLLAAERAGPWMGPWGGPAALALWHALLGAPLVAAIVLAAPGRIEPGPLRAALACGAEPRVAWRRLVRPRLVPAAALGAALAFALSLGEGTLAAMLGAGTPGAAASPLPALFAAAALLVAFPFLRRPGRAAATGEADGAYTGQVDGPAGPFRRTVP